MARWIQPMTRLSIYLRDGSRCVYCGRDASVGALLSLDHVIPRNHGGGNKPHNLVTSCRSCNSSRQDTVLEEWYLTLQELYGASHVLSVMTKVENRKSSLKPHRRRARLFLKSLKENRYED